MGILSALVGPRVYLDANILIYALEGFALFASELQFLFDAIQEGKIHGVTSELCLAELLVRPILENNHELRVTYERLLSHSPVFSVLPVTREILVGASEIRARHRLRLPDAIHVATAQMNHCSCFLTNDTRLRSVPGMRVLILSDVIRPN
jgi:predicted nucleic acid-binding protein